MEEILGERDREEEEEEEYIIRIASLTSLEPVDQYVDARGRMHLLILIGAGRREARMERDARARARAWASVARSARTHVKASNFSLEFPLSCCV